MRGLLASPLGLLVGLALGALGSGGSIIAVPALVHGAGQTPQAATAISLMLVAVAALTGLPIHYRAGRVRVSFGLAFGALGVGGSLLGSELNRRIDPNVLLLAFSGLILIAAWRMVTACPTCTHTGEAAALSSGDASDAPAGRLRYAAAVVAVSSLVGFLTGLFGVGGGFVIVPALTLVLGFNMPNAIGTSILVVAVNSLVALTVRIAAQPIDWTVAGAFTVMAALGSHLGGRYAARLDAHRALRIFAAGLVALSIYTAVGAVTALVRS